MIHVLIGTKAQYVKTAPVLHELDRRHVPYRLIDSGQHGALAPQFRAMLSVRDPDCHLRQSTKDITSVVSLAAWLLKYLFLGVFFPSRIFKQVFDAQPGICVIHGDTPSTLLGLFLAKRCGISVAHLEAGLRSFDILRPFPEELIRIITMRTADLLFAPSAEARENLAAMKVRGRICAVSANTNIEAIRAAMSGSSSVEPPRSPPRVVVSIHRAETILRKSRLQMIVDVVCRISRKHPVLFCVHPPTRTQLARFKLDVVLREAAVPCTDLLPYPAFIGELARALFVVSDGGSVQEECSYLGVPCLIMRDKTERSDGLGKNAVLAKSDAAIVNDFLDNYESLRKPSRVAGSERPSAEIVDVLLDLRPAPGNAD